MFEALYKLPAGRALQPVIASVAAVRFRILMAGHCRRPVHAPVCVVLCEIVCCNTRIEVLFRRMCMCVHVQHTMHITCNKQRGQSKVRAYTLLSSSCTHETCIWRAQRASFIVCACTLKQRQVTMQEVN